MPLRIEQITRTGNQIDIYAHLQRTQDSCPNCQAVSLAVHGRYWRHPQDLPWLGLTVRLHLEVQRFACGNTACDRKTFAAGLAELLPARARRTARLKEQHLATAYLLGGEAGGRLLQGVGMPLSGETHIRDMRQSGEMPLATVRVVGVDDWAFKKGQTYGTMLVDLERQQPIDLLETRETEAVTAWFQAHPEIEIVSRDRGKEYIKAATDGAPRAEQVADRWHLLHNLREAVISFLQQQPAGLQAAVQPVIDQPQEPAVLPPSAESNSTEPEAPPEAILSASGTYEPPSPQTGLTPSVQRQERFEQVQRLKQAGYSDRAISRQLKISTRTVRKYVEAEQCPRYPAGRVSSSKLTPWLPYLQERWRAGYTNASQLWREIEGRGFSGCLGLVGLWAAKQRVLLPAPQRYSRQQPETGQPPLLRQSQPVPCSAGRASWLIILDEEKLDDEEQAARSRMLQADPLLVMVDRLARQFIQMVKERSGQGLDQWLKDVAASGIKSLTSFANGLRSDLAAVHNALSLPWSNGQVSIV
ncbi:MAG TPA: ISL3 family transposase [Anaerolineae bacterium]|nr:ISL3 family transposase [Anaerolineae bacterium]